jgi:hypothetical protein
LAKASGEVYRKILERLRSGEWVTTNELLNLTGQKYLDRRIRELRDEEGWRIVHERRGREHGYRLISLEKAKGRKRHYLSSKKKENIFLRDDFTCQICGRHLSFETAQVDHKIPLIRDGDLSESNLQTLCVECNVYKRGQCHKCTVSSCKNCILSDPSLSESHIVLQLPRDLFSKLEAKAEEQGKNVADIIVSLLCKIAG